MRAPFVRGLEVVLSTLLRFVSVLVLAVPFVASVYAQTPTGSIVGTVIDSQQLPVEGATVTLTNQGTNYTYTSVTSSAGAYEFLRIDSGIYKVTVTKENFKTAVVSSIKLDAATEYSVRPVVLALGTRSQTVIVEAGAETVNTTSPEITDTVEKKQIDDLPILDRNVLALLELEPGINMGFTTPNYDEGTEIAGGRPSFTNMTLDGINIQDNLFRENTLDFSPNLPFSSQAQEFTVTTQNAGPESGGGSSQVSIVTPRGTNTFHGEGFWYYRTNAWAANSWFNNASGTPLPALLQNQGGGNIGGPIKKDKLFVYGYYELLRARQQTANNTTILSPTIVSALNASTPTLPFTYQPFDSNGNPVGSPQTVDLLSFENTSRGPGTPIFTVDPTMLKLINREPSTSNNTNCGGCDGVNLLGYLLNARNNATQDNYGIRLDYNLNSKSTITGSWLWNRQVVDRPDIDQSFDTIPLVQNNDSIKFISVAWRWNPGSTFTNEVRFGFDFAPAFFNTSQNFSSGFLIGGTAFTNPDPDFLFQGRNTHTYTWQDNASWVKGNHTLKFGTQVQRITIFDTAEFGIYPTYDLGFSSQNQYTPNQTGDFPAPSGASISNADYANATAIMASATGILSDVTQSFYAKTQKSGYVPGAPQDFNYRQNLFGFYAGDTWRFNRKLTFTYGLRWDYYSPVNEANGLFLLPEVTSGETIAQTMLGNATLNFAGGPSPRGLYNAYWKAFSPNIGLAWDPFGNGKTAIRAGFSMSRVNDDNIAATNNAGAANTGLAVSVTNGPLFAASTPGNPNGITVSNPMGAQNVPIPPFGIPTTFATNADNAVAVANATGNFPDIGSLAGYAIDPNLHAPYVEQWNLSVEHEIGWNTSVSVSYLGNHGVGLYRAIDVNQLLLGGNTLNGAPANFIDDFNRARSNGFLSLAANGSFVPDYNPSIAGSQQLTFFPQLYQGGFIDIPFITNYIYQGQIGALETLYHQDLFDSNFNNPGPPNQITNFFPNPYIFGGDLLRNQSFATYHAGVVEFRRRLNRGLYFQGNYVFSKAISDFGGSQSQFQPYQDNARPFLEKAREPFDITHSIKGNFTYELPIGEGHRILGSPSRLVGLLVDGWQTGSFITWQSGAPFSILSQYATFNRPGSRSANNTAFATQSHQALGKDVGVTVVNNSGNITVYGLSQSLISSDGTGAPPTPQLSCTPAVSGGFCNPQPGEVGNLPLFAFDGPSYFGWDLSASKDFNLTEKLHLTFRTEAFNVLNHNVFAMNSQDINSTTFGQISGSVSTPRILQMSLRLKF